MCIRDSLFTDLVTLKFYVAGFSARYMWETSLDDVYKDLNNHLGYLSFLTEWMQALMGDKSRDAVNHLYVRFGARTAIVSQYVTRQMSEKCAMSFVTQARTEALLLANPSFEGWVFEMKFFVLLTQALANDSPLILQDESWTVAKIMEFDTLEGLDLNEIFQDGCWLKPKKFNQGGFDALQLFSGAKENEFGLRVTQITIAKTHSLKLQYVIALLQRVKNETQYKITELDVKMVVPEGRDCYVPDNQSVSYTHLRAHETVLDLVCRLLLEKKKKKQI
eukprot:TRINITY_DN1148_c0_g1_i1.p1 TRINITY_DN1148_c0_g1~~TRINITY_DN1148_c0_g1_i1.p1  ORF type:complete len:277 (-),score=83.43 TRINITY_DN1148_c0_g1_i1:18-848(-)